MAASQEEAVSPENLMDEVSDFYGNTEAIKTRLTDRSSKFAAGQIQHCLPQWQEITHEECNTMVSCPPPTVAMRALRGYTVD